MAVRPGEEIVATLFGDVHYFYGPPTDSPPHHRFDKGSYVYLFENAGERRARIEIANQPGTDEQDAFDGFLDATRVRYSYKQECVVTITIGEHSDPEVWHLPWYDPGNQNKYHYPLHSLDIYFWTQKDTLQFLNGVRRVLPPAQVEFLDEPGPPPQSHAQPEVSAVVSKLEHAAISDPQYGAPAPPPVDPPPAFAPMAYNPAAPAAPEAVRPREKTPPPEDGGINPLQAAVAHDYALSPGFVPPPQYGAVASPGFPPMGVGSPAFAPPPGQQFAPPPSQPGLARASTMPTYGGAYPGSPGFSQGQIPGQQTTPVEKSKMPAPPPGGWASFSYASPHQNTPQAGNPYAIHQIAYRPTEEEMAQKYKPKKEPKGKLEENAGRLERGVTGVLKKFEKKFG